MPHPFRSRLLAGALVAALPAIAWGAPAAPAAHRLKVSHAELDNGLQILHVADARTPRVTVQVYYHVGSKNEPKDRRGIAHMFEHMLFKGSTHLRPEEHARHLDRIGGQINAYTTEDITAYHDTIPKEHMDFAMRLEAERMQHATLTPSAVESEREVVKEEKRWRLDSDPIGKTLEQFRALAYTKHPYAWTAAGAIEGLDRVTPEDCRAFYGRYYRPNNATLIVVGDVSFDQVKASAKKHFGPVPRGPAIDRTIPQEPPQTALKELKVNYDARLPIIIGGFKIPKASHPDSAALEVLGAILSRGQSSRMFQRLVRKDKIAVAAGGVPQMMEDPGLFLIFAFHLPTQSQQRIKDALLDEMAKIRDAKVEAAELAKARAQLTTRFVNAISDIDGIAERLGHYQYVAGGWQGFGESVERFNAVTADDLQRVAKAYMTPENLTLVMLQPGAAAAGGTR